MLIQISSAPEESVFGALILVCEKRAYELKCENVHVQISACTGSSQSAKIEMILHRCALRRAFKSASP